MISIDLHEFEAHVAEYARRVKNGETVVLCEANTPIAEVRPMSARRTGPRPEPGLFRGRITVTPDFFSADDEIARDFGCRD
jgi:antitoxin (DNA-binding transcriptional repressor) of toxin-antitoxin stability system